MDTALNVISAFAWKIPSLLLKNITRTETQQPRQAGFDPFEPNKSRQRCLRFFVVILNIIQDPFQ